MKTVQHALRAAVFFFSKQRGAGREGTADRTGRMQKRNDKYDIFETKNEQSDTLNS